MEALLCWPGGTPRVGPCDPQLRVRPSVRHIKYSRPTSTTALGADWPGLARVVKFLLGSLTHCRPGDRRATRGAMGEPT